MAERSHGHGHEHVHESEHEAGTESESNKDRDGIEEETGREKPGRIISTSDLTRVALGYQRQQRQRQLVDQQRLPPNSTQTATATPSTTTTTPSAASTPGRTTPALGTTSTPTVAPSPSPSPPPSLSSSFSALPPPPRPPRLDRSGGKNTCVPLPRPIVLSRFCLSSFLLYFFISFCTS